MRMRTLQQPFKFVPAKHLYVAMYGGGMIIRIPIMDKKNISPELLQKAYDLLENKYGLKIENPNKTISFKEKTALGMPDNPNPISDWSTGRERPSHGLLIFQLGTIGSCKIVKTPTTYLYGKRMQYLMLMMPESEMCYDIFANKTKRQLAGNCKMALQQPLRFIPSKHLNISIRHDGDIHNMSYHKAEFGDEVVDFLKNELRVRWKDENTQMTIVPGFRIWEMNSLDEDKVIIRLGDIGKHSGRFTLCDYSKKIKYTNKKVYVHLVISKKDMVALNNKI